MIQQTGLTSSSQSHYETVFLYSHNVSHNINTMTNNLNLVSLGDALCVYGTVRMDIPSGGKHARQTQVLIPAKFKGEPTVTATVYSKESPGTMFTIYNIQINDLGQQTQVAFSAANVEIGAESDYQFVCDYVVIGEREGSSPR